MAKGAQIHLVIAADTDIASGLLLAIFNVIDNNSDPILSLSFGDCEPNEGANNTGLWQILWEQAAAQGITVTVASGDPGSAGCEDQNAPPPNPATTGLQVNAFASTPFNIAVGGTDFNDAGTQTTYFKPNSQNDPNTLASAISYIPESTWNESCTNASFNAITGLTTPEANCNSTNVTAKAAVITVGGGGGPSHCFTISGTTCSGGYAKPAYQMFSGIGIRLMYPYLLAADSIKASMSYAKQVRSPRRPARRARPSISLVLAVHQLPRRALQASWR